MIGLEVGSLGVLASGGWLCFARASGLAFGWCWLLHETWSLEDSGGEARHYKMGRGISLICWRIARLWACKAKHQTHTEMNIANPYQSVDRVCGEIVGETAETYYWRLVDPKTSRVVRFEDKAETLTEVRRKASAYFVELGGRAAYPFGLELRYSVR